MRLHYYVRGSAYLCGTWFRRGQPGDTVADVTCKRCRCALIRHGQDIWDAVRVWGKP